VQSGDVGGRPPEDVQLYRLKEGAGGGALSARRTVFTVLSGVLVMCAGVLLIVGAALPWLSIAGVSVAAVREGGPDGAAATICMGVGVAFLLLGFFAAVGRRRLPRFLHFLGWGLAVITFFVVRYRSDILGNLVFVHNADVRFEGAAALGPGIKVVDAGLALGVAAPLLSLRQAWRMLRS
jgi:hypothetical protein